MKRVVAAAALMAGCLVSPVMHFGSGKTAKEAQHDQLSKLMPAQLTATAKWTGEPRVAKIRVWADDQYRAQNVKWEHAFDEQLDYANQVLIPMIGLRLEPEYKSWERHAPDASLDDSIAALAKQDEGDDVLVVIGLTSSLGLVSATFDKLGLAELGGHHVMLRGHADVEERKAFEAAFPDLKQEERTTLLEARRRHKTTGVLLHELAHSLGALHETAQDALMNPSYSHRAAAIDERNRQLMLATLEERLRPPAKRDLHALATKLLAVVEPEWDGWVQSERDELLAGLRAEIGSAPVGVAAVPTAALGDFKHAEDLFAAGDIAGARVALDPLLAAYPAHAELRVLACKIALASKDPKAAATCDRAAELGTDAGPAIAVAEARLAAGDPAGARAAVAGAETRLAKLAADKAAASWLLLAQHYQKVGALSRAEAAIAKAGNDPGGVATWAQSTRARYGVPRDGGRWKLTPDNEADAVAAVRAVLALVNANKFDEAATAATRAERTWPALPGLLAARCDLAFRRGDIGSARSYCARAIAQGPSSWAMYLDGTLALRDPASTPKGIATLRAAIALDPDLAQAWRTLAKALDRSHATADLEQLRKDYQAKFGAPLP